MVQQGGISWQQVPVEQHCGGLALQITTMKKIIIIIKTLNLSI